MSCRLCSLKLSYELVSYINEACGPCYKHLTQMMAGFRGIVAETRPQKSIWDNTAAYLEWINQLNTNDTQTVNLKKKDDYVIQRCDVRDMQKIVGLPKWLPLEDQIYTAWICECRKDEEIQEVLGLTYSQLFHVKTIIRKKLQKNMAYYHQIKKLEKEGKTNG